MLAEAEQGRDTQLQTPNPDSSYAYLPDNAKETNEFCARFDPQNLKRSGRVGYRGWATEFEKQVEMAKLANQANQNDPHVGRTITTPVSRGGSSTVTSVPTHATKNSKNHSKKSRNNSNASIGAPVRS